MNYLQDFNSYNESIKKFLTGAMIGASLLGSPTDVLSQPNMSSISKKNKDELSVISKNDYLKLIKDLQKKGYSLYTNNLNLEGEKYLFVSSTSPRKGQAINSALKITEDKIDNLDEYKGLQVIYYIFSQNTWQFIVITELSDNEDKLYDRETETWR
jgi:hypothetical protein